MTSGAATSKASEVAPAAPADLPVTVRDLPPGGHLEFLLRQVLGNLNGGRPDVAMTNMCHALRVACKNVELTQSEDVLLRLIDRDHGGIA